MPIPQFKTWLALLSMTLSLGFTPSIRGEDQPAKPPVTEAKAPEKSASQEEKATPETEEIELLKKKPEEKSSPSNPQPANGKTPPPVPEPKSAESDKKPGSDPDPEDAELLKSLRKKQAELGEKPEESPAEKLERALQGMRDAQSKIEGRKTGKETQEIQARVIKDLDELIEQTRNQMQKPPQNQKNQNQQQNEQKQSQNKNKQKNQQNARNKLNLDALAQADQQNSGQPKPEKSPADLKPGEQKPGGERSQSENQESQDRVDQAKAQKAKLEQQRQFVNDVWGHLPPHLREEMLNVYSEKYLPKYEELIRRYYQALAEKNRKSAPGGSRK